MRPAATGGHVRHKHMHCNRRRRTHKRIRVQLKFTASVSIMCRPTLKWIFIHAVTGVCSLCGDLNEFPFNCVCVCCLIVCACVDVSSTRMKLPNLPMHSAVLDPPGVHCYNFIIAVRTRMSNERGSALCHSELRIGSRRWPEINCARSSRASE